MPIRIALIHALAHSVAPANAALARAWPECDRMNLLDDSLSTDLARSPHGLDDAMTARVVALAGHAVASGARGVLFTCSAFGPCIAAAARRYPSLPVLTPTGPMIDEAIAAGVRIGLVATFAPTLATLVREFPAGAAVRTALAPGALAALDAGDVAAHDALAAEAAHGLVASGCGVIALAQVSLARAAPLVAARCGVPVLTTVDSAVRALRQRLAPAGAAGGAVGVRRGAASLDLAQGRTTRLPMPGASAVAVHGRSLFLAEDDEGVYRCHGGRCALWAGRDLHEALGDLEGLAVDGEAGVLYALAEESGELVALSIAGRRRRARSIGRLPRPGRRRNKGFEGLAFVAAGVSPNGRASLVAAHEGRPRRVAVFALPDLAQTHDLKLPDDAREALEDLSDVAVDPQTGLVLLLSEESRRIGIFAVEGTTLRTRGFVDVDTRDGARPEGLAFVTATCVVVATEGPATLIEYRVTRRVRPGPGPSARTTGRAGRRATLG